MINKETAMKYFLFILSAITALTASNIALAQNIDSTQPPAKKFKKHYIEIDRGDAVQGGANNEEYNRMARALAPANDSQPNIPSDFVATGRVEDESYGRLAYGNHVHQKLSIEFAQTQIAFQEIFNFRYVTFPDFHSITLYEATGIYYVPISDNFKFTFRGGVGSYSSDRTNDYRLAGAQQEFSGETALIGIGADFYNVHFEYRTYDLSYSEVYKGEEYKLYDGVSIFTVGYKFRF